MLNSISVKLSDLVWKLRHCLWTWRIKTLLCRFLVLLSLLRLPVWKQRKKEVWISKYVVVYIFTNFATYSAAAIWPHKVFFSVYSFLVVSRNFNYAINLSCNAIDFNFADSCLVLYFCVYFRELFHLTRDLSQAEKKINVVTSWVNAQNEWK